jgi:hypothetical protein
MWWDPPDEWAVLLPRKEEDYFEVYYERVSLVLPNFPSECLKQTLFDHGINSLRLWGWLNPFKLTFREEMWSTEDIVAKIASFNDPAVQSWQHSLSAHKEFRESKLGSYMTRVGTWPVTPIVLDNTQAARSLDGSEMSRFQLLEGYHRLAYLRAVDASEEWTALPEHRLWLALVTEGES